jgi:hypothetical protein
MLQWPNIVKYKLDLKATRLMAKTGCIPTASPRVATVVDGGDNGFTLNPEAVKTFRALDDPYLGSF